MWDLEFYPIPTKTAVIFLHNQSSDRSNGLRYSHVLPTRLALVAHFLYLSISIPRQSSLIFLLKAALILDVILAFDIVQSGSAPLDICHSHLTFHIIYAASDITIAWNLPFSAFLLSFSPAIAQPRISLRDGLL